MLSLLAVCCFTAHYTRSSRGAGGSEAFFKAGIGEVVVEIYIVIVARPTN